MALYFTVKDGGKFRVGEATIKAEIVGGKIKIAVEAPLSVDIQRDRSKPAAEAKEERKGKGR